MPDTGDVAWVQVENLPDGTVVVDRDRRIAVFTRAAERITGLRAVDVVGKDLADGLPLEEIDGRSWWDWVDPWNGLATRTGHAERLLLLPGGRELLATSRYVRPEPLAPVHGVVVSLRDTRSRAREELSRAELVSTVAHELRSPLTSVKGFTATLLNKWDRFTDAQKRLMLETVDADADRVTRLISELLDISRIDSGRLTIRRQVIDVPRTVARHIAGIVAGGGVEPERFEVRVVEPLPDLWADADKLDQVLANLLENAVHHGSGLVTVVVEPDGDDSTSVTVMDEGEGVPADQHVRVFTRFWRSGKRGGTGLGLYIVRGLVEAHGGSVSLGSAPGGGALFRFVLPAGTPEMPA